MPVVVALFAADQLGATRAGAADADLAPYRRVFAPVDADPAHLLVVAVAGGCALVQLTCDSSPGRGPPLLRAPGHRPHTGFPAPR